MKQTKPKSLLDRNQTQTLLTTLKLATVAGTLSLTMAGWGLLAHDEAGNRALAAGQDVAMVATPAAPSVAAPTAPPEATPSPTSKQVTRLDVVQWVQDMAGRPVAVVRDRRGTLWYVLGSDVSRIEQGQRPLVAPQPVRTFARTAAS